MTGYTGSNGSTGNVLPGSNVNSNVNSIAVSTVQGATAQSWAGVTAAENNSSLGNSNNFHAPGNPNPEDKTPGNLAVAQPGGANVAVIQNTDASSVITPGWNLQTVNGPVTPTGGGNAPQPVSNNGSGGITGRTFGWTVQNLAGGLNEDGTDISVQANSVYTFAHAAGGTITLAISGGTSPYTVALVEVDGAAGSTLPGPSGAWTLTASTGVLVISSTTQATPGTYTFGFRVSDSSSPTEFGEYGFTVVIT